MYTTEDKMNYLLMTVPDTTAGEAAAPNYSDLIMMALMIAAVIAVFYFVTLRPQRKREKELKAQMDQMTVGDKIVTIGGVVGTVANIREEEVTITTSVANTMITFRKTAISSVTKRES